ncbi:MAG: hypothetical protein K6A96_01395, partial [Prevotella sp.]|nr:hypothetical protein [Prevotella sp.]
SYFCSYRGTSDSGTAFATEIMEAADDGNHWYSICPPPWDKCPKAGDEKTAPVFFQTAPVFFQTAAVFFQTAFVFEKTRTPLPIIRSPGQYHLSNVSVATRVAPILSL